MERSAALRPKGVVVFLTDAQKQKKVEEWIAQHQDRGLPWDTLGFDYLRKDLEADIWDENGNELPDDQKPA
jgi:uncharacterized protein HemY